MGRTMMVRSMGFIWRWLQIIPVDLSTNDRTAVRESIRWLQSGGVLGIFPEGGIERPGKQIRPFQAGVGFLVAKARSPVLLIHVSGIPVTKNPFMAFFRPCRAPDRGHRVDRIPRGLRSPEDLRGPAPADRARERLALCEEPVPGTKTSLPGGTIGARMISSIEGVLVEVENGRAHVQCGGLVYEVLVPAADQQRLAASTGEVIRLHTLHVLEGGAQGSSFSSAPDRLCLGNRPAGSSRCSRP